MLQKTAILTFFTLIGCRVNPTLVSRPDGTFIATTGASLMTKSAEATGVVELPNGTKMSYTIRDNDETIIPGKYIDYKTIVGLADAANTGEATRETNETQRHKQDTSLKKAESADSVKIKNFVPPPVE